MHNHEVCLYKLPDPEQPPHTSTKQPCIACFISVVGRVFLLAVVDICVHSFKASACLASRLFSHRSFCLKLRQNLHRRNIIKITKEKQRSNICELFY